MSSKVTIFKEVLNLLNKQADNNKKLLESLGKLLEEINEGSPMKNFDDTGDPSDHPALVGVPINISTSINKGKAGKIDLMQLSDLVGNISELKVYTNTGVIVTNPPADPPSSFPLIHETDYDTSHIGSPDYENLAAGQNIAYINITAGNDRYIELKVEPTEPTTFRIYKYKFKVKFNSTGRWSQYSGQWGDKTAHLIVQIN